MSEEDSQDIGGLSPQYHTYKRQKCFIAYTEQAQWSDDLLSACREVLSRPEFNLESDYARKHFYPDVPLRQKALELIANARYGIYDLSCWRDEEDEWQMPRNVFIELGMAVVLNRPTLLIRHASNRELELPECLKSVRGHILEFSGETTLKRVLAKRLPQWVNAPPDRDWWNRYCIFGGRMCEYREAHPRAKQWGQKALRCHISDGPDVDRDDFRGVVEEVLGRFSDVAFEYLGALPVGEGYDFLMCTLCQTVRSTSFAIHRVTPHTPAETFIAIGMSVALETQFDYRTSKMLLTENVRDVPSLLSGYEVVVARSDGERKKRLRAFVPTVMHKVRETAWKPRPLPFAEMVGHIVVEDSRAREDEQPAHHRLLNPYIAGPPVSRSETFTGREDLVTAIEAMLLRDSSPAVFLHGQRRMGMTSFLQQFSRQLSDRFLPIYFDVLGLTIREDSDLFHTLMDVIAESLGLSISDKTSASDDSRSLFINWIGEITEQLRERKLVLILDEFEHLDQILSEGRITTDLLSTLRAIGQEYKIAMLFCSHSYIEELSPHWRPLFTNARVITLSYLAEEAARRLVVTPVTGVLSYVSEAVNQVIRETGGHPYLLQLVCSEAFEIAMERGVRRVSVDIVQEALQSSLEKGMHAFAWMWDGIDHEGRTILIQIALGNSTPTGSYDVLTRLLKQEILAELDGVYRFRVPLFQRWVAQKASDAE